MRLKFITPMFPILVEVPPEGDDWIHEIKYDGYRTQLVIDGRALGPFLVVASTGRTSTRRSCKRRLPCPRNQPSSTAR